MTTPGQLMREDGETIAYHKVAGGGPCIIWLGGFHSDMQGAKALALSQWAQSSGRAFLRFDYFGHGQSSGQFQQGTISRWRADVLAVIDHLTQGPLVVVGSSMGGWLACLAALARPDRVRGLALVAPAADFTGALIKPALSPTARAALERDGVWMRPSAYEADVPLTAALLEDGERWSILRGPIAINIPVRIVQGAQDPDVPWRHALALADAIQSADVVFTLLKDGDHRLSRPQDLQRLIETVADLNI